MPHATEETGAIDTAALSQLDGKPDGEKSGPRELLDTIDKLRYLGVDSYVELPQIIVVGDQSSGKSSVLEAISRVKFPAKSGLCTRFATELVLRTSPDQKVEAHIIHPRKGFGSDPAEQRLDGFSKSNLGSDDLEKIMDEAKEQMGLGPEGSGFSDSVLRVQIQGPDLPQLTLVDLPGFFHVTTTKQSEEGHNVVEALTAKYMAQKSSIILAVIAANNDLENQVVLDKAKKYDPRKERTLGIITKPDTLERNSSRERNYINVAKNGEGSAYQFKLGWHVLRNRNELESEANTSYEERDEKEKVFFESTMWKTLSSTNKGIEELRSRLSSVLFDHVKQSLPEVIKGIEDGVNKRRQRLVGLGEARSSPGQHRAYLGALSNRFERLARDAVRGLYNDDGFFGAEMEGISADSGPTPRKLRARIRLLNRGFALVLAEKGLTRVVKMPNERLWPESYESSREHTSLDYDHFDEPEVITWNELNEEVKIDAISDQGTEFPGSMNPALAFKLFKKQVVPWEGIATRHIELVMDSVKCFIDELLKHVVVDSTTKEAIVAECVEPFLEDKEKLLAAKLEELLDHYKGDYACQVDEAFLSQLSARVRRRMESTKKGMGSDISEFNTEGVIDSMQTYYEMSLSTFTENIMILAVENCLIRKIPDMFASTMITSMDDDILAKLGSETRKVREERETLQLDLNVLEGGLRECKKYRPARELTASRPPRSSATRLSSSSINRAATPKSQASNPPRTPANGNQWQNAETPGAIFSFGVSNGFGSNASGSGSSFLSPGTSQHTCTSSAASSVSSSLFPKTQTSFFGNGNSHSQHSHEEDSEEEEL